MKWFFVGWASPTAKIYKWWAKPTLLLFMFFIWGTPTMASEKQPMGNERFEMTRFDFNLDQFQGHLRQLPSQTYPLSENQRRIITNIFPIPIANCVGTHQLDDNIEAIRFKADKLDFHKINTLTAGGDYIFTRHAISKHYSGFAQTRSFNLIDFEKHNVREYCGPICRSMSEHIEEIWTIDPEKPVIMFRSFEYGGYAPDPKYNQRYTLRLYDFSGKIEKLISEKILEPKNERGFIEFAEYYNGTIFIYRHDQLTAYDLNFNPVEHPVVRLFEQHKEKFGFFDMNTLVIHPQYPFAWFDEDNSKANKYEANWIVYWGDKAEQGFHLLLPGNPTDVPRLSPDGEWLIISSKLEEQLTYIAFPVVDDPPYHLSRPVMLGSDYYSGKSKDTFTTDPIAFVVLGPHGIDRYELPPAPKTRVEIDAWNNDPQPYINAWLIKQGRKPTRTSNSSDNTSGGSNSSGTNSGGASSGGVWDKLKSWLF